FFDFFWCQIHQKIKLTHKYRATQTKEECPMSFTPSAKRASSLLVLLFAQPTVALADELNGADTAWILTATALVLFMTLPGLALFYGGLVRSKNILSVLMQCFAIACGASLLWMACGYSLAFTDGNDFIGGLSQ